MTFLAGWRKRWTCKHKSIIIAVQASNWLQENFDWVENITKIIFTFEIFFYFRFGLSLSFVNIFSGKTKLPFILKSLPFKATNPSLRLSFELTITEFEVKIIRTYSLHSVPVSRYISVVIKLSFKYFYFWMFQFSIWFCFALVIYISLFSNPETTLTCLTKRFFVAVQFAGKIQLGAI